MKALTLLLNALLFATAAAVTPAFLSAAEKPSDPDIALKPAHFIVNPWRFHILLNKPTVLSNGDWLLTSSAC